MTDDASPENLRKFLESDDPAMVRMGLSMAKGSGVSDEILGLVAGLYMWHDDKNVRAAAKSAFMKHAPDELKTLLKETWQTSYRTIKRSSSMINVSEKIVSDFKGTPLDSFDLWRYCFVAPTCGPPIEILGKVGKTAVKPLTKMLDKNLKEDRYFYGNHAVCRTLNLIGGFEAIDVLIRLVEDTSEGGSRSLRVKTILTTASLKTALVEKGLSVSGTKEHLIQRLIAYRANAKSTGEVTEKDTEKLLKSENPVMIQKGLSMVKKDGVPEELLPTILGLYMWNDDRSVRAGAKSVFTKSASDKLKTILKENWKTSYRTLLITGYKFSEAISPLLEAFKLENDFAKVVLYPLVESFEGGSSDAARTLGEIGDKRAVGPLIKALENWRRCEGVPDAVRALGEIGDERAVDPLIKVLEDEWVQTKDSYEDRELSKLAADALGAIGDKRAVEPLIKALGNENEDVRYQAADALGAIGDARAIEPLIKALEDDSRGSQSNYFDYRAARALDKLGWTPETDGQRSAYLIAVEDWKSLVEWGELAVEPLIGMLSNDGWWVRKNAMYALGEIGDARAVEPLIKALGDEDSDVHKHAAEALGKIGDARAVEPLIGVLGDDSIVHAVASALGGIGDVRAVEPLIEALGDDNNVIEALGKIGDERAVEPLIEMLSNDDRHVRMYAAGALGKIGDARAVDPLIKTLRDTNPRTRSEWVRVAIAKALGEIGDERAVEPLIGVLSDSYRQVRDAVKKALKKLDHEVE